MAGLRGLYGQVHQLARVAVCRGAWLAVAAGRTSSLCSRSSLSLQGNDQREVPCVSIGESNPVASFQPYPLVSFCVNVRPVPCCETAYARKLPRALAVSQPETPTSVPPES